MSSAAHTASAGAELDRARQALFCLDPNASRDDWVKAGMAAHAAGLDFEDFDSWSAGGSTYNPRDARDVWRSFKPEGGIGPATLFRMAQDAGRQIGHATVRPIRTQPRATSPALDPAAIWARGSPATDDHAYIHQKRGVPDGLRVLPAGDPLTVSREGMGGALMVPVVRPDGSISSLQLITPPETATRLKAAGRPAKLNLPGCSLDGWFTVGELTAAGPCYLCEGIGQAWAVWRATGHAAVVAFGWGRVRAVARQLRAQHPDMKLVLVPDAGKEGQAAQIAKEFDASVVEMPTGWPENSDVNDLALRDGFDVLEALLCGGPAQAAVVPRKLDFLALSKDSAPARHWFIPGWLTTGLTYVAGAGGIGKSSLNQQQASAGALGRSYIGQLDQPFTSLMINCEDDHDELWRRQERICAHEQIDMADLADRLHVVSRYGCDNALVLEQQGVPVTTAFFKELREQVNDLGIEVLWLDNAAHLFLIDHDDRTQVTTTLNALGGMVTGRPFSIVIVGHPGKAQGSEYSGSVAWENAVRMRWFLGSRLPDQPIEPGGDAGPSDYRYLCKRKANYAATDYVRFRMDRGLLVPETPDGGVSGMVAAMDEKQAERVCISGFKTLREMGIKATDSNKSPDFLPAQILAKRLGSGYSKGDLARALNRLMSAGVFVRGEVDRYGNRAPRMGLVLVEETAQ